MQQLLKSVTFCLAFCTVVGFYFSSEVLAQPADGAKQRQEQIQQSRDKLNTIRLALAKDLPNEFLKKAYPAGYSDQDGKLILSWRVAILPALGEEELWKQFRLDQPWDSEHNRKLIPKMPAVFKAVRGETKEGHTYYRGFAGEDAMFPLNSPTAEKVPAGDRSYFPVFCRPFVKTPDGTSNTFLIAEAGETVPWTKPEELVYDAKQPLPKLGGQFDGDFVAMSSDGTTRLITRLIPEPALRAAITAARGENIQFKAAAEGSVTIEFVTPEMEERKYALGRLAEKSPHGSMTQITDATSETALAGIVAEGRAVPWTKPDDLIFDDTFQTKENAFAEGAIMFANGSVRYVHLQKSLDLKQFRALFTIDGKEPSPLTSLYPPGHTLIQPTYATVQETVRHAEARSQHLKNLRHMALAFHNYQDTTKGLPPAIVYGPDGKPWHSWRVVMLPYLGYGALYQEYDGTVPWDHPKNAAVLNKMPEVFRDPLSDKPDSNKTRYLLATGAGTAFPTKPAGNVVAQALAQPIPAQPAPPKPVAKDGRQPIEYQPFNPALWKAKNQSTWLFPWEGERVVLLTTTADLDPKTMAALVKRLDAAWKLCGELVGQSPNLIKQHNGKVTIAAVPDLSFTFNVGNKFGFGFYGSSGIEVAEFYGPQGDFERFRKDPERFPDHYFLLIGQNHSVALDRMSFATHGSALLLRHICMEGAKSTDSETQARQSVVRYENAFAQSKATFAESFFFFGAKTPRPLNDTDGKPFATGDLGLLFASCLLKIRQENGGNEWVKRFYHHLSKCPPVGASQPNEVASVANGQLLNWVVAASLAAGKDLSPLFRDRWRFPFAPEVWQALKSVDWKKSGLTADNVFDAMPIEHLPIGVAMTRPSFLTPERRKQNLLVGGTFEDDAASKWKLDSFRANMKSGAIEGGVVKEGQKAAVLRTTINDDTRFSQTVTIKPGTRYLLSGWIKTKDVEIDKVDRTYGKAGATLSLWGGYEHSRSLVGTNDWTYSTLIFDSGNRTEVGVLARLGYWYSTASGEAWFDDLCLIPIGESPVRPVAQSPPPAPGPDEKDNLLVNGSFEEGPDIPENFGYLPNVRVGSTDIKGWTVTRGNIDVVGRRLWVSGHGQRSIDLHGTPGFGGVKQAFKTVVGQRYQVSFLMSGTPKESISLFKLAVRAADKQQEFSFDATGKSPTQMGWTRQSWDFVAISAETTLEIHTLQTTAPTYGPIIDDVSVIALGAKAPTQPLKAEAEEEPTKSAANWKGWPKDAPPPAIAPFNAEQAKQHQEAWAKHLGVPVEYTNSIGMKFRLIPPGEFTMGSTPAEIEQALKHVDSNDPNSKRLAEDLIKSEGPQHKVILTQPYYLGAHEVRQQDYESVTGVNPSIFSRNGPQPAYRPNFDTSKMPVENVSWNDATDFCSKLSIQEKLKPRYSRTGTNVIPLEGNGYRLPSEGEWEYACRAGTTTRAFFAKDEDASQFAWLANPAGGRPYPVGQLKPNPFGLFDIYGNNMEWVQDGWTPTAYEQVAGKPFVDPATSFVGAPRLMMRGVVWPFTAAGCRSSSRHSEPAGNRRHFFGVRAALSVEAVKLALANPVKAEAEPDDNQNAVSTWKGWPKDAPAPTTAPFNAEQAKQHQEAWAKHLSVPVEYTNSIGMKFRLIPPGEFLMGNTSERIEAELKSAGGDAAFQASLRSQAPQHRVILTQPIYLGAHEVTQGNFESVTGNKPSHFAATGAGRDAVNGLETTQHPVDSVSWNDVAEFCAKLSEREKLKPFDFQSGKAATQQRDSGYRLPTEAEWERACRAGTVTTFWSGNTFAELSPASWFGTNSQKRTHPVGTLRANPFGLYDVHGNVWEWVLDSLDLNYYQRFENESALDPSGPNPAGPRRGLRGGSWQYTSRDLWAAYRHSEPPALRHRNIGFRVALSVAAVKAALTNPAQIANANARRKQADGDKHREQKEYAQAIACYREVVQHEPNNAEVLNRLAWVLAVSPQKDQPVGEALKFALRASQLQPGNGFYRNSLGAAQYRAGQYAEALSNLAVVVETPPKNFGWMSHNLLFQALCHERLGDRASAQAAYFVALELLKQPGSDASRVHEARLLQSEIAELGVLERVPELFTLKGHTNSVLSVAVSPDGKIIASGSADRTLKLWDAASGQELRTLKGDLSTVTRMAFSPDSKTLAAPGLKGDSGPGDVTLWDVATGTKKGTWKGHISQVWAVAFSPDGKQLASSSTGGMVKLWDAAKGQEIRSWQAHTSYVLWVAFSSDGKRLATGAESQDGKYLKVWDIATGQEQLSLKGHTATNGGVAFSPDGKRLVSGSSDQTVKLWDASSGKELRTLNGHTGQVGGVVFSPDGKWIASACYDGTAKLWDAATGHETRTLRGQQGGVSSVAISPDGKRLVTGNSDQTVRVWDISGVKPIPVRSGDPPSNPRSTIKPVTISGAPVSLTLQSPARGFSSVAFSSDGQRLVTSSLDQTVRVWDSVIGEERLSLKGGSCAALSRDEKWLVSGGSDKVLRVWDASNGQEKLALKGHTDNISGVAFSLDGQRVASASDDQTVRVWDVASGKESLTLKGHSDAVRCVAFTPDGKRLASAGRDQIVKLWDATSGDEQLTLRGHKAEITSIAFSPDGTSLASGSHDQSVKLWNCANGRVIRTLEGHDSGVMSVSFSADGKRLVSASGDRTVRVWDSASGQPLFTLKGHASQVVGAVLSPDGNRIASASFDRTAKVWELAAIPKKSSQPWKTLEAVRREYSHADKDYLAAARDSRSLINGDFSDGLKEWLTEGGAKDFQVVKQGMQATLTTAGPQQLADTGRLYQYFKVPAEAVELQFSVHGGADSEQTHVALWHGTELKHRVSGRNDNSPFQVSWNVMSLRGDIVSLEIVDHSLSDWGFIGVQGFKLVSQKAPSTPVNDPKSRPLVVDLNQVPLTLKGHSQQVTDVAFNADGTRIASASQDGTVKIWDAVTGQVTHTLKSSASRLAFSPDGKRLATGGHDNAVTLWDVSTGQVALRLSGLQPAILGVAFAPDGQRLAAGSADGTLKVWDISNGQEKLTIKTPAWQVAFSPDGKQLASAGHADSAVKVWDATNGQELFSLKLSQGGANSLMFSPDGTRLATSGHPSGPTVWDLSTGRPVLTLKAAPWSIAFDPTGQWIATGDNTNGVQLSDAVTGKPLALLKGNTQRGSCVAFSVDGKRLASASDDLTVKVWDLVPGASPPGAPPRKKPAAIPTLNAGDELLTLKGHGGDVESVVFSADGKRLVTASEDQTAKIWDAADGNELLTLKGHTGPVTCVAITADGKQVATGGRDHLAKLWDATTGRETHSLTAGTNYLTSVAFSPDGKRLASAAILAAKVWDTTTGQAAFDMQGHFANVNAIVFSPDGKRLASCSHDMTVKLRDATNGRETLTLKGHRDAVTGVAFTPDGKRIVSCSHDQTLKVWDTTSGNELLTLIGHTSYVTGVVISHDGKRLASVSWDSTARLWDAESGQELLTVNGHSHRVNSVAFSPDGKRLATASDDRTVKIWDISLSPKDKTSAASRPMPAKEVERPVTFSAETARVTQATQDDPLTVTLKGHAESISSLAISPDGKWLASASSDGVVVWDVADRKPRFTLRSHGQYAISSVAISPDGKRLAAGVEKVVKVWDAATGAELLSLDGKTGRVNGIAFSSDGQRIASATQDQTVTVWDSTSGKVIDSLKEKLQSFGAIAFSPDGQWLAVGVLTGDTTGKVRKATSLEESFGLHGHNLYIKSLAFSADGKRLASASDDGSVKVWDTLTGDDLLTMRDRLPPKSQAESRAHHSHQTKSVALSLDGKRVVSAGNNEFVTVWDAVTGQKLFSLEGHQGEVRGVAFSPDGKWVASAGADATVKVWTLADRPTLPPDGTILKANVDPKKAEAELKALEGTWQITDYATIGEQPVSAERAAAIKEQRWIFQGDVLTFATKDRSEALVITVDPTQPLKAMDLSSFDQDDSFPSMLGVYSLAGDSLKLALSPSNASRPKELKLADGVLSVITLTRANPADVKPSDGFNFHTWRPASKNLQRMNVKAKLANRGSLQVGQLDRGFGLPETIFRWGVIGLPAITSDAGIPEAMWKEIASISHIVVVTPAVNDAMLKQLSQHRGLITLYVTGTWSASATGIAELKKCPYLMGIVLEGSPEVAETVSKLTALSNLRDLTILNATATKELVAAITQFKELESLNLPDAGVTDEQAAQIATLKNLKFLVLQQARAADKDKLKLSDKGLRSLMSLKDLNWLDLQGHSFSAEASAEFKASLPNCQVLMNVSNPKTNIQF